jgi:hypothetical protein
VIDLKGDSTMEIAVTLDEAFANGFDAVLFRNFEGSTGPTSILVVRDPAQLRSPHAAFDPAKRTSDDLLAGFAYLTGSLGAAAAARDRSER